ncbi:SdpI family protein (plasmid) [Coraliomargarita sp. W4R53]
MDGAQIPILVAAVALCASGVLAVWLARRGRDGRLPRNQVAGVRTSLTLSSDTAWHAAHRASAHATAIAGCGPIVAGATVGVLILVAAPTETTAIIAAGLLLTGAAWLIVWSLVGAARAQRAAQMSTDRE